MFAKLVVLWSQLYHVNLDMQEFLSITHIETLDMDILQPMLDAVVQGEETLVNMYIQLGATLDMKTPEGQTALHWTAGSTEGEKLVNFLITRGAELNIQDNEGYTPLHIHALRGRLYGVSSLLHSAANPNICTFREQLSPLHIAILHKQSEIASVLMAFGADTQGKSLSEFEQSFLSDYSERRKL